MLACSFRSEIVNSLSIKLLFRKNKNNKCSFETTIIKGVVYRKHYSSDSKITIDTLGLNLDYALGFVKRFQTARRSGTLDPEGYREKSEAKRLILKLVETVVDSLMHISG